MRLVLHGETAAIEGLVFFPDGRRLASWSANGVRVWESDPRENIPVLRGHSSYVYPVAYSPDGQWIASGSWDKTARLWDARTGELCAELRHPSRVMDLAFSPDGSRLVTGCGEDNLLRVWNKGTGQLSKEIRGVEPGLFWLALSPDGTEIAAANAQGAARIVAQETGQLIWEPPSGTYNRIAYSRAGRLLAAIGPNGKLFILDAATHEVRVELVGHTMHVVAANFDADGSRLVSAGYDQQVRVWDVNTGKCLATLAGHTSEVFALVFHPNGKRIATAGRDGTIRLWDTASGEEVARLSGHTNYVWSLAFSPDGKTLISGSGDGTIRLWDTEPLGERYQARHDAEALRPAAERLVQQLFRTHKSAAAVHAAPTIRYGTE